MNLKTEDRTSPTWTEQLELPNGAVHTILYLFDFGVCTAEGNDAICYTVTNQEKIYPCRKQKKGDWQSRVLDKQLSPYIQWAEVRATLSSKVQHCCMALMADASEHKNHQRGVSSLCAYEVEEQ
jgi:hypothetical protein